MDILIKGTLKCIPIIGAVIAVIALPLCAYGLWPLFALGLVCGVGASVAGFVVAYKCTAHAMNTGSRGAAFAGVMLRMLIYLCVMSVMTATFGLWPGIGSAAGCLTAPLAVIARNMLVPKLRQLRGRASDSDDRQYIYEPHMRGADGALRYVFIRGSYMEKAYGGHIYMTHRRFRRLAAIRRASDSYGLQRQSRGDAGGPHPGPTPTPTGTGGGVRS
ncbi:MAG: hypothetical protein LBL54_00730 [Clostridiales Family XIII bacterium]|jgi:hypothetical protein|nr:hypothetical protein [Clostridiales Family XIII bacterium]